MLQESKERCRRNQYAQLKGSYILTRSELKGVRENLGSYIPYHELMRLLLMLMNRHTQHILSRLNMVLMCESTYLHVNESREGHVMKQIDFIQNGTVIDHIKAGESFKV